MTKKLKQQQKQLDDLGIEYQKIYPTGIVKLITGKKIHFRKLIKKLNEQEPELVIPDDAIVVPLGYDIFFDPITGESVLKPKEVLGSPEGWEEINEPEKVEKPKKRGRKPKKV